MKISSKKVFAIILVNVFVIFVAINFVSTALDASKHGIIWGIISVILNVLLLFAMYFAAKFIVNELFITNKQNPNNMETTLKKVSELLETNEKCPLPLDVLPNQMGINLCSVDAISWQRQKDGQLVSLTIYFIPSNMENQNLNFGQAIEALKQGKLVARKGWNGKGMFIFMRPADELTMEFIHKVKSLPESAKKWLEDNVTPDNNPSGKVKFTAYLCMKAADGSIVNGWLASQTDILAEDWEIVE